MYDEIADLLSEIAAGEDTYLEFKEARFQGNQVRFASEEGRAAATIAEVFVSMANTEGGVILFGVNKESAVVGVDAGKKDVLEQFVVNCAVNNCVPEIDPRLDWVMLPDEGGVQRLCLKVDIPKARFYVHQTTDGRFLKRVGSHRHPIPAEQLGRMLTLRRLLIPFEERPAFSARLDDFDAGRFDAYYRERFGKSLTESGLALERLLSNLKLAIDMDGEWRLTNLGVLLFTDQPSRFLAGAFVDLAVYGHGVADGNTLDSRKITGTVPDQIDRTLTYLQTSPYLAVVSEKDGLGRSDKPAYNAYALQEAIVNALVHRDYELDGSQVIVTLFPDRIEIKNPGGLHNTLTPENLYAGCQPMRRNQHLAGFLRDFRSPWSKRSYMEARGEGFLTMIRESERLSGQRPALRSEGQAITLTIFSASPLNV